MILLQTVGRTKWLSVCNGLNRASCRDDCSVDLVSPARIVTNVLNGLQSNSDGSQCFVLSNDLSNERVIQSPPPLLLKST